MVEGIIAVGWRAGSRLETFAADANHQVHRLHCWGDPGRCEPTSLAGCLPSERDAYTLGGCQVRGPNPVKRARSHNRVTIRR
jgi:hypothetical protein